MEFITKEHKEKAKKLFKVSPLLIIGAICMGAALHFRIDLGTDYTTIIYLIGIIVLSVGLSILDYKVNGDVSNEPENKA